MTHWSVRYVGRSYVEGTLDCAALAALVNREVFGREIALPAERSFGLRGLTRQIEALKDDYAAPTDTPREGDGVLMVSRGRLEHIGVYCLIDGQPWVLHAHRGAGQVVLSRLRDLDNQGLKLADPGFYRWR